MEAVSINWSRRGSRSTDGGGDWYDISEGGGAGGFLGANRMAVTTISVTNAHIHVTIWNALSLLGDLCRPDVERLSAMYGESLSRL